MTRLDEIEARLTASESAAGTNWEVGGLTVHGGYAAVATDALDVSTDEHLPEECAELFAHAPADLAALVRFAREVEVAEAKWRRRGSTAFQNDVRFRSEVLAARRALEEL